jgi:2',3'-cyclic-nucleotide 2'-phosphodiesterase (5'-nucleotidase family)
LKLFLDYIFKASFLILFFIISVPVHAEDFRIIYSSSLSGNLYSCVCGLKLSVGLAKRASFFGQRGINPSKDILVDTGNSLDVKSSKNKAEAIFHSFQNMGYTSVGFGTNDLQEEIIPLVENKSYPLQSANVFIKKFFGSTKIGKPIQLVKKGNKTIGIISLTSPTIQYTLSGELKKKFIIKGLESTLRDLISSEENKADTYIILLHGTTEEAVRLASMDRKFIVIYGDETNRKPIVNKSGYLEVNGVRVYSTFDLLGDKIGILNLTESEKGITIKSSEVIEMNVDKLSDSDEILSVMKQYNIQPE